MPDGEKIDVSVIISTYNRCELLVGAICTLMKQESDRVHFEVIIVDNNSTDDTRTTVQRYMSENVGLRYLFEAKQGLSHARNAGISAARGSICAFSDDDVRFPKEWVRRIKEAFDAHPSVAYVGGRVLPQWGLDPPVWASPKLPPFALQDHGDSPRLVGESWRPCLVGANLACRREVFEVVGLFDPVTQRVKGSIGSLEDREWEGRVWNAGMQGVYLPDVFVFAPISTDRLRKSYHRKWHLGHGKFLAILRDPAVENGSRRLLDVAVHHYRQLLIHLCKSLKYRFWRNQHDAFLEECYCLGLLGFLAQRWSTCIKQRFMGTRRRHSTSISPNTRIS